MPDKDQLKILEKGVDAWNTWRQKHSRIAIDLSTANLANANIPYIDLKKSDLSDTDLTDAVLVSAILACGDLRRAKLGFARLTNTILNGADLTEAKLNYAKLNNAQLRQVKLIEADLRGADMREADLKKAILRGANLSGADISGADLRGADLSNTNLTGADLSDATLINVDFGGANLTGANLTGTDFSRSMLGWTILGKNDLSLVKGLRSVIHSGPSTIGLDTIYLSKNNVPDLFWLNAGVPDDLLHFMGIRTAKYKFYSCFISHAESDTEFAEQLRNDLIANKVRCWHYHYDMRGGQFWRPQIDHAIKEQEKLILICSEESLDRPNVVYEIIAAIEIERETHSQKLFPIRLDDYVFSRKFLDIADIRVRTGQWREDWVRYMLSYHILDFTKWKDLDLYKKEFKKLLDALENPAKRYLPKQDRQKRHRGSDSNYA